MALLQNILKLRNKAENNIANLPDLLMRADTICASVMYGTHSQRKEGSGEKFWQFRDYHPTDRPQDIDWRQSAKSDAILIKQKEWQTRQKTYLWCANSPSMRFSSHAKIETKQSAANIISLSLALLLSRSEEQIGLYGDIKTGRNEETIQKISRGLIDPQTVNQNLPDQTEFSLPAHAAFIGVGDFLSPIHDIEQRFEPLAAQGNNTLIIQTLDPAELNLGYNGRIRFNGAHNHETQIVNHVPSVRAAYAQRINEHISKLQTLCQSHNWSYIMHQTDQDITETLRAIWMLVRSKAGRE